MMPSLKTACIRADRLMRVASSSVCVGCALRGCMMLPADQLARALAVHGLSYRLLMWMGEAIGKGFIPVWRAHSYGSTAAAAEAWILANYHSLPPSTRPEQDAVGEFARFFSTYLVTSFDVLDEPGTRIDSHCGCTCSMCARLVAASHLQPKHVDGRDKRRAVGLIETRMQELAAEHGLPVTGALSRVTTDPELRRYAAYSTYGHWLIKRLAWESDGGSILVLWRMIAWKPTGSPIPDFKLRQSDFVAAEEALLTYLRQAT